MGEQVSPDAPDSSSDLAASMIAKENMGDASFSASNAADLIGFAKAMVLGSRHVVKPVVGTPATLRVGIHSGSCISGIVGTRNIKYCLLGRDVVTAALMEHLGVPDHSRFAGNCGSASWGGLGQIKDDREQGGRRGDD